MEEESKQHEIFCKIGIVLTSCLDPDKVLLRIMDLIGEYFSPEHWSLLLTEEDTSRMKFEIVKGVDASKLDGFFLEPGEGIAGWVSQKGVAQVVGDVRKDDRFSPRVDRILGFETRSVVCVPVVNGKNQVIGVIQLVNKLDTREKSGTGPVERFRERQWQVFTEKDMAILSAIGAFSGIAVENAFLHQKITEMAMVDSLTGLKNRRFFMDAFHREVERVVRYGHSICVLMMDVDGLKQINDNHGHIAGDAALQAVADILVKTVRESDIVARIGGDEFVVIMPRGDKSKGVILAGRIREMMDRWNEDPVIPGVRLGLSIGIQEAGPENIDHILKQADDEMYLDKAVHKSAEKITSGDEVRAYLRGVLETGGDR